MPGSERLYLICVGTADDWVERSGGGVYYFVAAGEKYIPVFTTLERAKRYMAAKLQEPGAHLDLLESGGVENAAAVTAGDFSSLEMDIELVAELAADMDADWLIRDPRPGDQQEVLRVPK
jgi:hypothetical protein